MCVRVCYTKFLPLAVSIWAEAGSGWKQYKTFHRPAEDPQLAKALLRLHPCLRLILISLINQWTIDTHEIMT